MQPYPGNKKWSPAVVIQGHSSAPSSYIVNSGGKEFRQNSQDLRKSTAIVNRPCHFVSDEPWMGSADNAPDLEQPRPPLGMTSVSPAEELLDLGQASVPLLYTTKRGRVVRAIFSENI